MRQTLFDKGLLDISNITFTELLAMVHASYCVHNDVGAIETRSYGVVGKVPEIGYIVGIKDGECEGFQRSGQDRVVQKIRITESPLYNRTVDLLKVQEGITLDGEYALNFLYMATANTAIINMFLPFSNNIRTKAGVNLLHKAMCIMMLNKGTASVWLSSINLKPLVEDDPTMVKANKTLDNIIDVLSTESMYKYRTEHSKDKEWKSFNVDKAVRYAKAPFAITDENKAMCMSILTASQI